MSSGNLNHNKQDLESALNSLSSDLVTLPTLYQLEASAGAFVIPRRDTSANFHLPGSNDGPSADLVIWKESALISLQILNNLVGTYHDVLSTSERARIIFVVGVFVGQDYFTDDRCEALANGTPVSCFYAFTHRQI